MTDETASRPLQNPAYRVKIPEDTLDTVMAIRAIGRELHREAKHLDCEDADNIRGLIHDIMSLALPTEAETIWDADLAAGEHSPMMQIHVLADGLRHLAATQEHPDRRLVNIRGCARGIVILSDSLRLLIRTRAEDAAWDADTDWSGSATRPH